MRQKCRFRPLSLIVVGMLKRCHEQAPFAEPRLEGVSETLRTVEVVHDFDDRLHMRHRVQTDRRGHVDQVIPMPVGEPVVRKSSQRRMLLDLHAHRMADLRRKPQVAPERRNVPGMHLVILLPGRAHQPHLAAVHRILQHARQLVHDRKFRPARYRERQIRARIPALHPAPVATLRCC